jgi:hypothetical protein
MDFSAIDNVYDYFGHYFVNIILVFHIAYFAVIFGIVSLNISYLNAFNVFIHTIVCLFLIIRFNPLRNKVRLREYDSPIIFSSSLFLLLNMTIIEALKKYIPNLSDKVNQIKKIV